jgi:ATP-dependent DNA helicase Q4
MSLEITIKAFIKENREWVTTGRNIARIFHGLCSPSIDRMTWSKNKYWGSFKFYDFKDLVRMANKALMDMKMKQKQQHP